MSYPPPPDEPQDHPHGQDQPHGQPQYGQPQYGQPQYGQPQYGYPPPDHPRAMTAMILGILSLVLCQLVGPFAWKIGGQAMREIDASGGRLGGRGLAQAGYILGVIASVLLIIGVAIIAVLVVIGVIGTVASA